MSSVRRFFSRRAGEFWLQTAFLGSAAFLQVGAFSLLHDAWRRSYASPWSRSITRAGEAEYTIVALLLAGLLAGSIGVAGLNRLWQRVRFRIVIPVTLFLYLPLLAIATLSSYLLFVSLGYI